MSYKELAFLLKTIGYTKASEEVSYAYEQNVSARQDMDRVLPSFQLQLKVGHKLTGEEYAAFRKIVDREEVY